MPTQEFQMQDIDSLVAHPENPRRGDVNRIATSIDVNGFYGALIVQKGTNKIIAGNHRWMAAKKRGLTEVPTIVIDVDDATARRILLVDNRESDLAGYNDQALADILQLVKEEDDLEGTGYNDGDLLALLAALEKDDGTLDPDGDGYTKAVNLPQYEPVGPKPDVSELYDESRTKVLRKEIAAADLPPEVRDFLSAAAGRHTVFNYQKVAEFYPHASPEEQRLFEESALIIIDIADAIRLGFARFEETIQELRESDET